MIDMLELHGAAGQTIYVNPKSAVTARLPRHADHFPPGTRCVITTADGKSVMVTETCAAIRDLFRNR